MTPDQSSPAIDIPNDVTINRRPDGLYEIVLPQSYLTAALLRQISADRAYDNEQELCRLQDENRRLKESAQYARSSFDYLNRRLDAIAARNSQLAIDLRAADAKAEAAVQTASEIIEVSRPSLSNGLGKVCAEVARVRIEEGFSPADDDKLVNYQLSKAAACYVLGVKLSIWPWMDKWWHPGSRLQNLVKAGQLIVAEIDRLLRLERQNTHPGNGVMVQP